MKREEAIIILRNERECADSECDIDKPCSKCKYFIPDKAPLIEAYDKAIKALEDIKVYRKEIRRWKQKYINERRRTGYWVNSYGNVVCTACGHVKDARDIGISTRYCDHCGAYMIGEGGNNDSI